MMTFNRGVDIKAPSTMVTEMAYATLLPNTIAEVVGDKLYVRLD